MSCPSSRRAAARGHADVVDWSRLYCATNNEGRLASLDDAYASSLRVIDPEAPPFSTLLRKPLPASFDGAPHAGGAQFSSPRDPAYQSMLAWVAAEQTGGETPPPLNEREHLFANTVEPVLASMNCTNAACHGTDVAVPFRLDAADRRRL